MKKIALIDGYGFVFRAYHSLPPLTRPDGKPVGAVYGFTNMLIKLLAGLDVTHAAIVFDAGSKTFRNDIFPAYKANRPPCPEDLVPQFAIVREAAESLNLAILEKTGFEADDIIATIAKKYSSPENKILIVSSDKDLMQLINENVAMYDAMKNKMIGDAEVREKFFVGPNHVLDILSLMGDASDNIPGVKGIGPKTAAELIQQFGSLENIFANLDQIKQDKRRQLLSDGVENAKISKILAALKEDVELGIEIEDLKIKAIDPLKLVSFLEFQGFRSLVLRVKKEFGISTDRQTEIISHPELVEGSAPNRKEKYLEQILFSKIKKTEITSQEIIDQLSVQALSNGIVTIDYHHNFVTISTAKIDEAPKEIFYFETVSHKKVTVKTQATDLFNFNDEAPQISSDNGFAISNLAKILENDAIKKVFFDSKSFLKIAEIKSYEDVSLINHLVSSSMKSDLRELIDLNLNEDIAELGFSEIFAELEKNKEPEIFSDAAKKADFFCFRNFAISQLYKVLAPRIHQQKLNFAYLGLELPLLQVIAEMENNGVAIDIKKLHDLSQEFAAQIQNLTKEIYQLSGEEFNIASTQQLAKILFEKLGLDSSKKSKKTGAFSTNSSVLEELAQEGHAIASKVLDFRKFSKLKNTYTDALPKEINPKTNRIHSNFSTTSTITGRFSSNNPNLQNIPIKSLEGKKIRESFVAAKDHLLISADYSQIELRVIAHVAKIDNLVKAFKEDKDIHRITAAQVFHIPEAQVTDEIRSKAKAINFGIIYGISAFGLARQLDIPRQEAAVYIKSYLETYPGIDSYMKSYIDLARTNGFVETISGRKCFIREINNKNPMIRNEAERLAINAPIQGSAADIIKKAMINLDKKFREMNLRSKIILQIHDELVVEAPKDEVEIATKILKREMEDAFVLDVPLRVDVTVDDCWK